MPCLQNLVYHTLASGASPGTLKFGRSLGLAYNHPKAMLVAIIVSYNVRQYLERCLETLLADLATSGVGGEVWVFDNASTDGSPEMVKEKFPEVKLHAHEANIGFASANNFVMRKLLASPSPPDYFFILNPDTEVLPGATRTLVKFMEENPQAALVGPKLLNPDGSIQPSAFKFPGLVQTFFDFFPTHPRLYSSPLNGRYPGFLYRKGKPFAIDHPLGAAMLVRRKAVEEVGLMDEGFFIYCEEIDWCLRFKKAGWRIYCVPQAEVIHHIAKSTSRFPEKAMVELWKSRYRFFSKHKGLLFVKAFRTLVNLGLNYWAMRDSRLAREGLISPEELSRRLETYKTIRGVLSQ